MISIHTRFHEAIGKLTPKQWGQFKTWREGAGGYPKVSVETQLNAINSILSGETRESTPIVKNNGVRDNHGTLFTESATNDGVGDVPDTLAKAHKLCETYIKLHRLSEADARKVVGLPAAKREATGLTEAQYRTFELRVLAGEKEDTALRTVKVLKG